MMALKYFVGLIFTLLIVTLAISNNQRVELQYFFDLHYETAVWVVALAGAGIGFILAGMGWFVTFVKLKAKNHTLKSRVLSLEKELKDVRSRPLPDEPPVYSALSAGRDAHPVVALPAAGDRSTPAKLISPDAK
jgi:uncharacterized integral membrane protein